MKSLLVSLSFQKTLLLSQRGRIFKILNDSNKGFANIILLSWIPSIGNVVFEKRHTSGGHFAASEVPEKLVEDLFAMFGKGGPAYGVVEGKDGY